MFVAEVAQKKGGTAGQSEQPAKDYQELRSIREGNSILSIRKGNSILSIPKEYSILSIRRVFPQYGKVFGSEGIGCCQAVLGNSFLTQITVDTPTPSSFATFSIPAPLISRLRMRSPSKYGIHTRPSQNFTPLASPPPARLDQP